MRGTATSFSMVIEDIFMVEWSSFGEVLGSFVAFQVFFCLNWESYTKRAHGQPAFTSLGNGET